MKNYKEKTETKKAEKVSDSEKSNNQLTESEEEAFSQENFEDALRRVSRKISEPDEETT